MRGQKPLPSGYLLELLTLGDHLKKQRLDLGLLQKEVAQELRVSKDTVKNWEASRTQPARIFLSRIVKFLGYLPVGSLLQGNLPAPGPRGGPELLVPES